MKKQPTSDVNAPFRQFFAGDAAMESKPGQLMAQALEKLDDALDRQDPSMTQVKVLVLDRSAVAKDMLRVLKTGWLTGDTDDFIPVDIEGPVVLTGLITSLIDCDMGYMTDQSVILAIPIESSPLMVEAARAMGVMGPDSALQGQEADLLSFIATIKFLVGLERSAKGDKATFEQLVNERDVKTAAGREKARGDLMKAAAATLAEGMRLQTGDTGPHRFYPTYQVGQDGTASDTIDA